MSSDKTVRVGVIQMSCSSEPSKNLSKVLIQIAEAAKKGAQIVCLQELFKSLYFCQSEDPNYFDLAESIPGPTTEILQETAQQHNVVIVASLFEKRANGLYHNTTAVIDADGQYLGKYRKMHIPDDPSYLEKFYFTPGDLGYKVFKTKFANVGVLICWDQWYPEAARLTALQGADMIVYPTAIGWLPEDKPKFGAKQYNAWRSVQVGHAISNEVFVISPNRVGREGNIEFWGGSFVADPFGEILYQASHDNEHTDVIDLDLNQIEIHRRGWPFLRDRRIDSYSDITKRFID